MPDDSIVVPKYVGLCAVKVNNLRALFPARIVLQIIGYEIIRVVRDHRDCFSLFQRERIHDQLIRIAVNELVRLRALEVFKIMPELSLTVFESFSLNREHTGIHPSCARLYRFRNTEEIGLRLGRTPERAAFEAISINQSDSRDKQ